LLRVQNDFYGLMQARVCKILNDMENFMNSARYFFIMQSRNGDLVTASAREVVLRLDDADIPSSAFIGPTLNSSKAHKANQTGYRTSKAELLDLIQGALPEGDELICLSSAIEIIDHYHVTSEFGRDMMRIHKVLPSETKAFTVTEAISIAERNTVTTAFGLDSITDQPLITIIMNDQYKVAAHVGEEILGAMIDETKTIKPWNAPDGSIMEQTIRNRFPKQSSYAI
jgi:hypothetical protein